MQTYRSADDIHTVAVIGAGLIGAGWIATFLRAGLAVAVHDPAPGIVERLCAYCAAAEADMTKLTFEGDLARAVATADFVQENGPEREDDKAALIARVDAATPADVVIASSTSSLAVTRLQHDCVHPERCVLGHPFNPVWLMPLVEVGGGAATAAAAVDAALGFYTALGKRPVRLEREIYGHIANRLTAAMFREAVSLVDQGVASVADVDAAIRFGPAAKWAIQGQFTTFHTSGGAGGLAAFLAHFAPGIVRRWETMTTPDLLSPSLQARLVAGMEASAEGHDLASITIAQDRKLALLLALLEKADGPLDEELDVR